MLNLKRSTGSSSGGGTCVLFFEILNLEGSASSSGGGGMCVPFFEILNLKSRSSGLICELLFEMLNLTGGVGGGGGRGSGRGVMESFKLPLRREHCNSGGDRGGDGDDDNDNDNDDYYDDGDGCVAADNVLVLENKKRSLTVQLFELFCPLNEKCHCLPEPIVGPGTRIHNI